MNVFSLIDETEENCLVFDFSVDNTFADDDPNTCAPLFKDVQTVNPALTMRMKANELCEQKFTNGTVNISLHHL